MSCDAWIAHSKPFECSLLELPREKKAYQVLLKGRGDIND